LNLIKSIEGKEITIVALGDSLTYGWMVSKGYLCTLRELLCEKYPEKKFNIINSGNPGDTARSGLYRFSNDVTRHSPDIVLIQFALNDAFNEVPLNEFYRYIINLINDVKTKTSAIPVLLTSSCLLSSEDNQIALQYYKTIERCSDEQKVPVAKIHEYWRKMNMEENIKISSLLQVDGVHPNNSGHQLMAESLMCIL